MVLPSGAKAHGGTRVIPVTLQSLVDLCAPGVAGTTALAIIRVESGGDPWSIDDDTTKRSYHPHSYRDSVLLLHQLRAEGHNVDAGLMQVNSTNWRTYGIDEETVLDPCTNVNVGSTILRRAYRAATQIFPPGPLALYHAFEIYNSGHAYASKHYADAVWAAGLRFTGQRR